MNRVFTEDEIGARIEAFYNLWGDAGKRANRRIVFLHSIVHHPSGKIEVLFYTANMKMGEKFVKTIKDHFGENSITRHNPSEKEGEVFMILMDVQSLKDVLQIARKYKLVSKRTYTEALRVIIDNLDYWITGVLRKDGEYNYSYFYTVDND